MNSNASFAANYFFNFPFHEANECSTKLLNRMPYRSNTKKMQLDNIKTYGRSTENIYNELKKLLSDNNKTFFTLSGEEGTGKQAIIEKLKKLSTIKTNEVKCSPELNEVFLCENSANILYSLTDLSHKTQKKMIKQFKKCNNPDFKVIGLTCKDMNDELQLGCAHSIMRHYFTKNQLFIPSLKARSSVEFKTIVTTIAQNLKGGPFFVSQDAVAYLENKKHFVGNIKDVKKMFAYITCIKPFHNKYIDIHDVNHNLIEVAISKKYNPFTNKIDWYRFKRDLSKEDIKSVMVLKKCDSIRTLARLLNMKASTLNDRLRKLRIKEEIKCMAEENKSSF